MLDGGGGQKCKVSAGQARYVSARMGEVGGVVRDVGAGEGRKVGAGQNAAIDAEEC